MRRLSAIACLLAAIGIGAAVIGSGAEADSTYRVDAIFDTAKGVIPGQLVKIAGARTGKIVNVKLTDDFKARIQMTVEQQFAPFRSDAECGIQPEGLISENFVQCSPGTPDGEPLRGRDGEAPTVPVENTSAPVAITDLFNIFTVPVRDRLSVVLAGIGGGVAARGKDLNEILLRASPTLRQVRRVTAILDDQRRQLATAVESSDQLISELAKRRGRVKSFIDQGSRVTARTARRRGELRETIRRLPALLDAARPSLRRLDELATSGTPTLRDLRSAAPDVERAVRDLRPFSRAAAPAIERVGDVSVVGRRVATGDSREVVALARRFARTAREPGALLNDLLVDLRDRGGVEGLLSFVYQFVAASARYDDTSHILPAHVISNDCGMFATKPTPGCSARFSGSATAAARTTRRAAPKAASKRRAATRRTAVPQVPGTQSAPKRRSLLPLPLEPGKVLDPIDKVLEDILAKPLPRQDAGTDDAADRKLLDFLLR